MKRYWIIQNINHKNMSDGTYDSVYKTSKGDKHSYIKKENGLYYVSFDNQTWIRITADYIESE